MDALNECREKCRAVKYVAENMEWGEKANHVGSLIAKSLSKRVRTRYLGFPYPDVSIFRTEGG